MTKKRVILISLIFIIVIVGFLMVINYIFTPYKYVSWGKYIMGSKLKYEFCTYDIPDNYEFVDFRDSDRFENALVLWKDKITNQHVMLLRIKQQLKLDPKDVSFTNRKIVRTFHLENWQITKDLRSDTFIPFFVDNYPMKTPSELEIRGVMLDRKEGETFSTDSTNIFYTEGISKSIGFYKPRKGIYKYVTHVFLFDQPMRIGFAIIRYKKTGDVIFAISYIPVANKFDRDAFLKFVKSVKFETQPFSDPYRVFTFRHKYIYK